MLVDTHCHLQFAAFNKDRDEIIKRARQAGVKKIINVGCDLETSQSAVALAEKYDFLFASIGAHPQEAKDVDEKTFSKFEKLVKHLKVVAIGECGLENRFKDEDLRLKNKQQELFKKQIELAQKVKKPLIIHCRNAFADLIEILKTSNLKLRSDNPGVIHFFSGNLEQAKQLLNLGFFISFTGLITFIKDYDKIIRDVPLDRILIETDAPFVAPVPYRGSRNEPAYVAEAAKKIAEIKNVSFGRVSEQTTRNAAKIFSF